MEVGGGERETIIPIADSCIKMGSDESIFNVSLTVRDSHKTVSRDHNL